jgi:multisubunit Na+/H+ antiporter MnhF subunit
MMNAFVVAAVGMLVAALPCLVVVWRGRPMEAVVAYQTIGAIAVMVLLLLAEGFQRTGEFEFPVLLAVLMLGSGLVFVRFFERWL